PCIPCRIEPRLLLVFAPSSGSIDAATILTWGELAQVLVGMSQPADRFQPPMTGADIGAGQAVCV
ncbi:hypothetical protein, partial [Sphaerotilus natans]|uniref:hypothetical protein n=1 Tax=Sphaerotilus natans TaxID=34103 RepID=UPI001C378ABC